jgi:hypothetical protein
MADPARPTLRCLAEDLDGEGWTNASDRAAALGERLDPLRRLHDLDHPTIRHAATLYPGDSDIEAERESISGLTNPFWWKLKISRYRGAVFIDDDGQAWLSATGIRREGERTDFYASFMAQVTADGPDGFLPTEADYARLHEEQAAAVERDWRKRIAATAIALVAGAASTGKEQRAELLTPVDRIPFATLEVRVERLEDDVSPADAGDAPAEIEVSFEILDWSHTPEQQIARYVVLAVISPSEDGWDVVPQGSGVMHVSTISESRLQLIVGAADVGSDRDSAGKDAALVVSAVSHSHITSAAGLTEAVIEGLAIEALCGQFFVPRRDPLELPLCEECHSIRVAIVESRKNDGVADDS